VDTTPERTENFAQLITRIKDLYKVNEPEIARRLGVHVSTVNNWVHGIRGTGRGPKRETLEKIPEAFPKITRVEVFAAAGRKTPGPLAPEANERLLAYFAELTEEQREAKLVEMKALAEHNRS
jgi:transcriptional regulator with XRE-family HTH domain